MKTTRLYDTLDKTNHEIRLLQILPSDREEEVIECILSTHLLNGCPKFFALSYVWGDANETVDIVLNGTKKAVTTNLGSALKHLRRTGFSPEKNDENPSKLDTTCLLWVDALCINQDDMPEKTHQVQLMGRIYSEAHCVLSWLGLDNESSELFTAFEFFEILSKSVKSVVDDDTHQEDLEKADLLTWIKEYPFLLERDHNTSPYGSRYWDAVFHFFNCRYFTRTWIIQEMALAKTLVFMTDSGFIHATKIFKFIWWIDSTTSHQGTQPEWMPLWLWMPLKTKGYFSVTTLSFTLKFAAHLYDPLMIPSNDQKAAFYDAVFWTKHCCVSKPEDALFALCGLPGAISVNYEKPLRDLYCDFFDHYSVYSDKQLDFLNLSGIGWEKPNKFHLPSWTPDISRRDLPQWAVTTRYQAFKDLMLKERQVTSEKWLGAAGCECDVVTSVEPELKLHTPQFVSFILHYAWHGKDSGTQYPTGITRSLALLRSFLFECHGQSPPSRLDPESVEGQYSFIAVLMYLFQENRKQELDIESIVKRIGVPTITSFSTLMCDIFSVNEPNPFWEDNAISSSLEANGLYSSAQTIAYWATKRSWRIFHTSKGYLGVGPQGMKAGDIVSVLQGCGRPVLLRKEEQWHLHVGTCFVLGFMDGEAAEQIKEGKLKEEVFEIH